MTLAYHCTESEGGLATYGRFQADALEQAMPGELVWIAPRSAVPPELVRRTISLPDDPRPARSRAGRIVRALGRVQAAYRELDRALARTEPGALLISCWGEYFAPFWAWRLRRWKRRGLRIGAVIHDPVRDHVRGPEWWHQWSVSAAYSFLDVAFIHEPVELDRGWSRRFGNAVVIPHGPYLVPEEKGNVSGLRRELEIPESAFLLLSFGHIRDGKNLDLLLEALRPHGDVWLLVAGREQSLGQRPVAAYQQLAEALGVGKRCRWVNRFIPDSEVWRFFTEADAVATTYSADFKSASGVLSLNAQFRKPVLASSGQGPVKALVDRYRMGVWVEPDSAAALEGGIDTLRRALPWEIGRWEAYLSENSWEENARRVWKALRPPSPS